MADTVDEPRETVEEQKEPTVISPECAQMENLAAVLAKNKSLDRKNNLLDHTQEVFQQLILHYPKGALDKFEEVSFLLKQNGGDLSKFLKVQDNRNY